MNGKKLTDKAIQALKPTDRIYSKGVGDGLSIEVHPNGGRYWRFRYRFGGKAKRLSLGVYPEVSLREVRSRLVEVRAQLRDGTDPSQSRQAEKQSAITSGERDFAQVSADWLKQNRPGWAEATYRKAEYVLTAYLQKSLKGVDVATLSTPEARRAIAAVAAPALAAKARGYLGSIMEFAIHAGLRDEGRTLLLKGAVPKRAKGHIAAATTPDEIKLLLKAVKSYDSPVTRAALELCMYTAQRPGVVAGARWAEMDLRAGEWHIPAERMKTRHAHLVPLSRQAVAAIKEMQKFTAGTEYVFPALARQKSPHLHRDALSAALRRQGLQNTHATHGFRAMFRTVARERLNVAADVLEAQLAHAKKGEVAAAYDRTKFLSERREAMQAWADWLATMMPRTKPGIS